jgi:hypothetical protein
MSAPLFTDVNPTQWQYREPRKNKSNGLNVFVSGPTRFQLERTRAPFGIQDGMEETSNKNLELDVGSQALKDWCVAVDNQNIEWIVANCPALFKKEMKREMVETLYRAMLTPPSKPEYNPLLRVKVKPSGDDATNVWIVVSEATATTPLRYRKGTFADVERNAEVIVIAETVGLWIVSKGCGMTFMATDVLVFPTKKRKFDFTLPSAAVQCEQEDVLPDIDPSVIAGGAAASTLSDDGPSS